MKTDLISVQDRLTITVEEAAKLAGISACTAYKLVHQEVIPHVHAGRRTLIPVAKFMRWLQHSDETKLSAPDDGSVPGEPIPTCQPLAKPDKILSEPAHKRPSVRTEIIPPARQLTQMETQTEEPANDATYFEVNVARDADGNPGEIKIEGEIPIDKMAEGLANFVARHVRFKAEPNSSNA